MTRKHFEALAEAIRYAQCFNPWPSDAEREAAEVMRRTVANNVADVCAQANPRFDRARFLAACGIATREMGGEHDGSH